MDTSILETKFTKIDTNSVSLFTKIDIFQGGLEMIVERTILKRIEQYLFKGKIIAIYGARQVGKTTLVKELIKKFPDNSIYLNCDEPDVRVLLSNKTSTELRHIVGDKRLVVIDEAQRVRDIGITLKLMVDNFPEKQIVVTGSSSFELTGKIAEPLTGRKIDFILFPFSLEEISQIYSLLEIKRLLPSFLVYGMYPEVVLKPELAREILRSIAYSYAFKDIFQLYQLRNPEVLEKLLQALALQLGAEVSYNELSSLVGVDKNTVANYIRILERAFITFKLPPFSRNLRNELKKLRKVFFFDVGVRNAYINNFNPIDLRDDVGKLWENFVILERMKLLLNHGIHASFYFWRRNRKEIDLIEEREGKLYAYEIKWRKRKARLPIAFQEAYPNSQFSVITRENFLEFLLPDGFNKITEST